MAICRFFLQGNCRYGTSCWNEHPHGGNQGYSLTAQRQLFGGDNRGGGGGGGRNSFAGNQNQYKWVSQDAQQAQQPQQTQQLSASDIVRGIGNEVTVTFEGGKMWPFTCMGFEKDMPSIPGFEDISTEEMRFEAYDALKQGNVQAYAQKVESLFTQVNSARQELKNPGLQLKQKLITFIEDARKQKSSGTSTGYNSLFNDTGSSGAFGSSTTSGTSLFGKPAQQQNVGFGISTFTQSLPQPQGLFMKKPAETPSVFGQNSAQPSVFGAAPQPTSVFGQPTTQSAFGNPVATTGSSVLQQPGFGGNTAVPQTPKVSLFHSGAFSTPTSQTPSTPGSFGQTQLAPQPFGAATPTQTAFGQKSQTGAFEGSQSMPIPSAFGAAQQNQGLSQGETSSVYTQMDKLTATELQHFQATTFKLGHIPTKPPPKELCF